MLNENTKHNFIMMKLLSSLLVSGCVGVIPIISESGATRAERWGRGFLKCADVVITSSFKNDIKNAICCISFLSNTCNVQNEPTMAVKTVSCTKAHTVSVFCYLYMSKEVNLSISVINVHH